MAQDVLIRLNSITGLYDLVIDEDNSDFASAEGFETAIPVSLFTDGRAPSSLVQNSQNRRGWVGNIVDIDINFSLGSLLWTLDQSRLIQTVLNRIEIEAYNALTWMLNDSIATGINVTADITNYTTVEILIDIIGSDNVTQRYITLWRSTNANLIASI